MLLPLPSFFEVPSPFDEEPHLSPVIVGTYSVSCPICQGKPMHHMQTLRHFHHSYAWYLGLIWIRMMIPRQRYVICNLTFTYDFGFAIVQESSSLFRGELVRRCHGCS